MKVRSVQLLFALAIVSAGGFSDSIGWGYADAAAAAAASRHVVAPSVLSVLKSLDYRYFVAGGTCAAISHGITTPVDVIKTKIQSNPAKYTTTTPSSSSTTKKDKNKKGTQQQHNTKKMGLFQAARTIVKDEGVGVLLGGLGATVVGYGIEGAMKFGFYEVAKPVFAAWLTTAENGGSSVGSSGSVGSTTHNGVAYLLASIVAGAVAAVLLCPMESLRIKTVTDPAYADKGLLTGLPKLIAEEGFLSTFSGLWAMLAKQVPYTFGKQVSFDVFAGLLYTLLTHEDGTTVNPFLVSVCAAMAASLVACILSQPGDMILTETYRPPQKNNQWAQQKSPNPKVPSTYAIQSVSSNFGAVVGRLYDAGGIPTFFTGTSARIVHVGLIITSQLVIYDIIKQALGLPATGSH